MSLPFPSDSEPIVGSPSLARGSASAISGFGNLPALTLSSRATNLSHQCRKHKQSSDVRSVPVPVRRIFPGLVRALKKRLLHYHWQKTDFAHLMGNGGIEAIRGHNRGSLADGLTIARICRARSQVGGGARWACREIPWGTPQAPSGSASGTPDRQNRVRAASPQSADGAAVFSWAILAAAGAVPSAGSVCENACRCSGYSASKPESVHARLPAPGVAPFSSGQASYQVQRVSQVGHLL